MQLGLEEILRALPHRPPALLVDRVHALEPSQRIVASRTLATDDPCFAGHFPGHPVLPGVLIVEALAQAGAVLAAYSGGAGRERCLPYLMNIEQARVRKPVLPGQTLELRVERLRAWGTFWRLSGEARVEGEVVATAILLAGLVEQPGRPAAPAIPEADHAAA